MIIEIRMPKFGETMIEGTLLEWRVAVGERVSRRQVIAEVETDKTTMELEASAGGVIKSLEISEGDTVPVGVLLATIDETGNDQPVSEAPKSQSTEPQLPLGRAEIGGAHETLNVSPAAEKLARSTGVNLKAIQGSGPRGRIVLADVERVRTRRSLAQLTQGKSARPTAEAKQTAPGSGKSVKIRRLIARKMEEGWRTIPHFYVTMAVDMTDVIRFRKDLGVTINDFVLAATARALRDHPWVNATWNGEQGMELPEINIAMAVATERGLYNPVIRNCERLSLKQLSEKAHDLADRAANQGRLQPEELEGGTFTITNMGMLGVESFCAIITPPQAAALAVGTVKGEIVVDDQGEPAVAPIMRLTLSADHRVLDGADAAEFLDAIKTYLEAPIVLVKE